MTTFGEISFDCPICGEPVTGMEIHSTNQMDRDTDFCPVTVGFHAVPLEVLACRNCGYAGTSVEFRDKDFAPDQRARFVSARICDGLIPLEARLHALSPDHMYYLAFLTAAHFGAPAAELGDSLLRASWCVRLPGGRPGDDVAASRYRREAVREFLRALETPGLEPGGRRSYTYLVAELLRREGDFENAAPHFERFLADPPEEPEWARAAKTLLDLCRSGDSGNRTFRELLGETG